MTRDVIVTISVSICVRGRGSMLNSQNCHVSCINTEESSRAGDKFDNSANLLALRREAEPAIRGGKQTAGLAHKCKRF